MDGGAWRATVHRVAESDVTEVTAEHTVSFNSTGLKNSLNLLSYTK